MEMRPAPASMAAVGKRALGAFVPVHDRGTGTAGTVEEAGFEAEYRRLVARIDRRWLAQTWLLPGIIQLLDT